MLNKRLPLIFIVLASMILAACSSQQKHSGTDRKPNSYQICQIFKQYPHWKDAAKKAERKWGTPVPTLMAFIRQESGFNPHARPSGRSDVYGFPQALDSTWRAYQKATGNYRVKPNQFSAAVDFIGWYNSQSKKRNKISLKDTYHLYLAYHEGHGGFERRSFRHKSWLKDVAHKVSAYAQSYKSQYKRC